MHNHSKKAFLIVNKFAGQRRKYASAVNAVVPVFHKNNWQIDVAYTQFRGHATDLASGAALSGFDLVIAAGGDGTVNEVAQGLLGKSVPMGIIPMGSGNGIARELNLPVDISECAQRLISGTKKQIDVCRFNNQKFFGNCGTGFDARVAEKMAGEKSRGFLRYVWLTIKESISFKPFQIKMKVDDFYLEKTVFLVSFANSRQFGNNAFIAPAASMSDGLIDVVVVNQFNKLWLPVLGVSLFLKMFPKLSFVECYKAKQIEIEYSELNLYQFDGEPGTFSVPVQIGTDAEKLIVIGGE